MCLSNVKRLHSRLIKPKLRSKNNGYNRTLPERKLMFRSPTKNEPTNLDRIIDAVYADMQRLDPDDAKYPVLLGHLERLENLKSAGRSKRRPSPDTILTVAGHIIGILAIVVYEQKHVMTSKAVNFVLKLKT